MSIKEYLKNNPMGSYLEYAYNVYSQNGEDGIINQLLKELGIENGLVVEFGAWDGVYLSNVLNLTQNYDFNSVLIESDPNKVSNFGNLKNSKMYNYTISPYKEDINSIDNILKSIGVDTDIILMSIDIDSCDYYVFESINYNKPFIIIIETDISKKIGIDFKSYDKGCSFDSIWDLSLNKGYTMVSYTGNCILLRNDILYKLNTFKKYEKNEIYIDEYQNSLLQRLNEFGNIEDNTHYLSNDYVNKINKVYKK